MYMYNLKRNKVNSLITGDFDYKIDKINIY